MDKDRKIAASVGALFIVGTVSGVLSVVFSSPVLGVPDYLGQVAAQPNSLILAALCVLAMGLSLAMVPVIIYPVLKRHNQTLALGYVVVRGALETTTYIAAAICWFMLIIFAQEIAGTSEMQTLAVQATGAAFKDAGDWIGVITAIMFSTGALMLYTVFFRSGLIPRWLSGWGFVAIILHLVAAFLALFGVVGTFSTPQMLLNLPIAVQEMVMAVWLIVRGFRH